jgi:hypothetical protein
LVRQQIAQPALVLGFLLERIQVLRQELTYTVCWLELQAAAPPTRWRLPGASGSDGAPARRVRDKLPCRARPSAAPTPVWLDNTDVERLPASPPAPAVSGSRSRVPGDRNRGWTACRHEVRLCTLGFEHVVGSPWAAWRLTGQGRSRSRRQHRSRRPRPLPRR